MDAWAKILRVKGPDPTRALEIVRQLALINDQISLLEESLSAVLERAAYIGIIHKLRSGFSVMSLSASWSAYRQYFSEDVLATLRIYPALVGTEPSLERGALEDFISEIVDLSERVDQSGDLHPKVREFLKRQLAFAAKGARDFDLRGVVAITDAADDSFKAWAGAPAEVHENAQHPLVQAVFQLFPKSAAKGRVVFLGAFFSLLASAASTSTGAANNALDIALKWRELTIEEPVLELPSPGTGKGRSRKGS